LSGSDDFSFVRQVDEIFSSTFSGVATYTKFPSTFQWWDARTNATSVVHNDVMFILGGKAPQTKTGGLACFNDVWVFADTQSVADYYKTPTTPFPQLAKGEGFQPYWIQITDTQRGAPWSARSNAYCLSFKGRAWLIGGVDCQVVCM